MRDGSLYSRIQALGYTVLGIAALTLVSTISMPVRLVLNGSASAPIGLFWVSSARAMKGDFVLTRLDSGAENVITTRGYLPFKMPVLKRIAATEGDEICRVGLEISTNGKRAAIALRRDLGGRPMPSWSGCHVLSRDDVLLLNENPRSFDGRYFGASKRALIIGRAKLLWAWS